MKKQTSPPNRRGRLILLCFVLGLILIVMLVGTVYLQHLLGRIHYVDSGYHIVSMPALEELHRIEEGRE